MTARDSSDIQPSNEPLYELSIYPFSTDFVFQEGLQSIVSAQGKTEEELDDIIDRAKVFYFTRKTGHQIAWEDYVEWRKTHPSPFPSAPIDSHRVPTPSPTDIPSTLSGSSSSETTQLTFQQITELIKSGKTELIPNNKAIPEAINSDTPSTSSMPVRKKPWEENSQSENHMEETEVDH